MRYLNSTNIKGLGAGAHWLRSWVKSIQHRKPVRIKAVLVLVLVFFTFSLAGCGGPESIYIIGASLANFIHTDRMPIDYIVDYDSGQVCNLLKSIEDGDPLCQKSLMKTIIEPPRYCYRTVGKPRCYVSPTPYKTGTQTVK